MPLLHRTNGTVAQLDSSKCILKGSWFQCNAIVELPPFSARSPFTPRSFNFGLQLMKAPEFAYRS